MTLDNPLSVSHIIADDTDLGVCTFYGADGSTTVLSGETERDVGPPQPQVSGLCIPFSSVQKARQFFEAGITFIGAGPDPPTYFQLFPTDENLHTISKLPVFRQTYDYLMNSRLTSLTDSNLSVSQISSAGGAICSFFGIDGSDTFVHGEETVDVGPPQVQISGVCDVD